MKKACKAPRRVRGGRRVTLSPVEAAHLDAAFEQMDLLLAERRSDTGLRHLVGLLRHLRAVRGTGTR